MCVCLLCIIHGRICGPIRTKEKVIAEVAESFRFLCHRKDNNYAYKCDGRTKKSGIHFNLYLFMFHRGVLYIETSIYSITK